MTFLMGSFLTGEVNKLPTGSFLTGGVNDLPT